MNQLTSLIVLFVLIAAPGLRADGPVADWPLPVLEPPVKTSGSKVVGEGKRRSATITLENTGKVDIERIALSLYFLKEDGSVGKDVPHTHSTKLKAGQTATVRQGAFFMEDDTHSLEGVVGGIEFADGSRWPPMPATNPARKGNDPVGLTIVGIVGRGELAQLAVASFNHGDKDVIGVWYSIESLDGDGKVLGVTNYGYNGSDEDPFLKRGKGTVLTGGKIPHADSKQIRIRCTNVFFADETVWQPK